jgi:hypothetical protein
VVRRAAGRCQECPKLFELQMKLVAYISSPALITYQSAIKAHADDAC